MLPTSKWVYHRFNKIARVVDAYARASVQERLTVQIRDCIQERNHWSAVVIERAHMCMQMRGIQSKLRNHHFCIHGAF